jgi:topoisomerase-4 subunit A
MVYLDGKTGRSMAKRFNVKGITRDKEYDLTKGEKGSQVLHFTANPNGEAEVISVSLSSRSRARIKLFDFDFSELEIKGRGAGGNILTKYPVRKIQLKAEGKSTLGGVDIYYDDSIGRLNRDDRGKKLGNFNAEDAILICYNDGSYELTSFELTNRYEFQKVELISKFDPEMVLTAIYLDGESKNTYIKKFRIETTTLNKKFVFISEAKGSRLLYVSGKRKIKLSVDLKKKKSRETVEYSLDDMVTVKGWKAVGNKFSGYPIIKLKELAGEETGPISTNDGRETSKEALFEEDAVATSEDIPGPEKEEGDQPDKKEGKSDSEPKNITAPAKVSNKPKAKTSQSKSETTENAKSDETFHAGDTIEMKIDLDKIKKGRDQLGLFDD